MATLTRMTKKVAYSVIPLANRRTPHRNYTSAILVTAPLKTCTTISTTTNLFGKPSVPTHHHFSARAEKKPNSDNTLLSIIESEINGSEDKFRKFSEAAREFNFKIVDNVSKDFITLTRDYQGEEIKATVYGPHHVRLNVSISKKCGLTLELKVNADKENGFTIYSKMRVRNPNAADDYPVYKEPDISEFDEKLQKAFRTFLEDRGFEPSTCKFLCEYMVQREQTKLATWLKCLKSFIPISGYNSKLFGEVSRATSIPARYQSSALAEKKSNSDDTFLKVVESEIECAGVEFHQVFAEALSEFPFKIEEEDVSEQTITLTREYQGDEEIKVTVHYKHYCWWYVELKGIVSNKTGLTLEFHGKIDDTDGFKITSLDVKNPNAFDENIPFHYYGGPVFKDLEEKFQNAFYTYLEDRGITPSLTEVLYDCMVNIKHKKHTGLLDDCVVNIKHKKHTGWLKHLKNFIAN